MMSALVGQDWRCKTYRELFIQWQAVLLESWHHTAHIKGCFADKHTPYRKLHPYLGKSSSAQSIVIQPRPLFTLETFRDGQRISILKELIDGE